MCWRRACGPVNRTQYAHLLLTPQDALCRIPTGYGANLSFTLQLNDTRLGGLKGGFWRQSSSRAELLHYPPPVITPFTLRRVGAAVPAFVNGSLGVTVVGRSLVGGALHFGVRNVLPNVTNGELVVYYGPFGDRQRYRCAVTESTESNLTCGYAPGEGANHSFTVELGGQKSAVGGDVFDCTDLLPLLSRGCRLLMRVFVLVSMVLQRSRRPFHGVASPRLPACCCRPQPARDLVHRGL